MIRAAWAAILVAWGTAACSRTLEQPPPPPPEAPPPAVKPMVKKAARPANPWGSSWGASSFATERPAAASAPRAVAVDARPAANTLNGDPDGLKQEDLQKAIDAVMPTIAACFDGAEGAGSVTVSFDADPSGRPANLKVAGGGAGPEGCVRGVLGGLRLPTFTGAPVPVALPLAIRAPVRAKTAAAPAAVPSGQPPPLFVNP
jgi:hypothetical protein